jgi:hypothetical protein
MFFKGDSNQFIYEQLIMAFSFAAVIWILTLVFHKEISQVVSTVKKNIQKIK